MKYSFVCYLRNDDDRISARFQWIALPSFGACSIDDVGGFADGRGEPGVRPGLRQ